MEPGKGRERESDRERKGTLGIYHTYTDVGPYFRHHVTGFRREIRRSLQIAVYYTSTTACVPSLSNKYLR